MVAITAGEHDEVDSVDSPLPPGYWPRMRSMGKSELFACDADRFPMMMRTVTMPTTMRGAQVSAAFWCVIRTLPSFWTE